MNLWTRFIIGLLLSIVVFIFTDYFELSRILSFLIAFGAILLVFLPSFYIMAFGTDIKKIEKALISYSDEPTFRLYIALGNRDDEEVEYCIQVILNKHKASHRQALYKTILALYKHEILTVKEEIKHIKPLSYQYYYHAVVCIEEGEVEEAIRWIELIPKQYMKNILYSELKLQSGQREEALKLGTEALKLARGIQKYSIYTSLQRQFPEYAKQVS